MGKLQKLDNRIQTVLQNGIQKRHRTVFVMIGNKGQDQKRAAGLTSDATIFEQFICTSDIRWCYYHETHRILGQTYDMCVLQDFEALTPNTLARTVETVVGGGLIVFLLKSMDSLRQLCTMAMDVHSRYRTEAHRDVSCRFNERFLLSLANNSRCLVLDDRWQVLPLSMKVINSIQALKKKGEAVTSLEQQELQKLKVALAEDGSPFAPLVKLCITLDQARSLVQFCAAISSTAHQTTNPGRPSRTDSTARSLLDAIGQTQSRVDAASAIVVVTASRGRGKSAALGLGLAAAIEAGLPNLCVTAPSPENLTTLMQFALRGLAAFGYEEHQDYEVTRSTDAESNHAIVRIDVRRQSHRQSLVYLPPWELASQAGYSNNTGGGGLQTDLVCVDEAAAIPLALVRPMIAGPRLVFMASTVNGYEGTGRSLSLKLIKQLREECKLSDTSVRLQPRPVPTLGVDSKPTPAPSLMSSMQLGKSFRAADTSRALYEVTLNDAIRYANGDPVEAWLTELLCLDCGSTILSDGGVNSGAYYPPPDQCQLFYVNRDTLFAYHKSTEIFLHRLMALYVASHYKNSPNDLQMLSDAPAHHIFCLLAPYAPESGKLPEILCVLQVCLEGQINKERVLRSLNRGQRPPGDLIPWTVSQQFSDPKFGELSGARVVRIATHPDYQKLGYGTRALTLLYDYYSGKLVDKTVKEADEDITDSELVDSNKNKKAKHPQEQMVDLDDEDDEQGRAAATAADGEEDEEGDEEELIEDINMNELVETVESTVDGTEKASNLLQEVIERKGPASLPPLLTRLPERAPEMLHYIGVSFGATPNLLRFWKRSGFLPVYLRQSLNELTGEFSCIMLKQVCESDIQPTTGLDQNWLSVYHQDFVKRLISLLPACFRYMDAAYALELVHHRVTRQLLTEELTNTEFQGMFNRTDIDRLRNYTRSLVDFHVVSDLLPRLACLYFGRRLPTTSLNKTQQVILLGMGLQHKTVERLASEFNRLLGTSSRKSSKRPTADDASTLLAQVEEARLGDLALERVSLSNKHQQQQNPKPSEGNVNTGWSRRIRGLLFVVMRELFQSLDSFTQTMNPSEEEQRVKTQLPKLVASSVEGDLTYTLNQDSSADEEDILDNDGDVDDATSESDEDVDNATQLEDGAEDNDVSDSELQRRASLVRDLISEEASGAGGVNSLNTYRVHGSEVDWAQAIVGHGSDLSSLNIKLSSKTSGSVLTDGNKKKRRNESGEHDHRRKRMKPSKGKKMKSTSKH